MNRYRILRARPGLLLLLMMAFQDMGKRDSTTVTGLPDDATLLRTAYDPIDDLILFFVHSETFSEVPDGGVAPALQITFTKEY